VACVRVPTGYDLCCSRIGYSRPHLQPARGNRRDVTNSGFPQHYRIISLFSSVSPIPASRCFVVSDNTAPAIAATSTDRDRKTRTSQPPDDALQHCGNNVRRIKYIYRLSYSVYLQTWCTA